MSDVLAGRLRDRYRVFGFAGEGLFLVSERDTQFFEGAVFADLGSALREPVQRERVVDELAARYSPAMVYYALDAMRRRGVLTDGPATGGPSVFFDEADRDPHLSRERLRSARIMVTTLLGDDAPSDAAASTAATVAVIGEFGVDVREGTTPDVGEVQVVLTTDYLHPALADVGRANREAGRAWLIARVTGADLWVGPLFAPDGACYACLTARLGRNRPIERYLARHLGAGLAGSTAFTPAHPSLVAGLVGTEVVGWLTAPVSHITGPLRVLTLNPVATTVHEVLRRPQCGCCGDPALQQRRMTEPVRLDEAEPTAGMTLTQLRRFVDPLTGIVARVLPAPTGTPTLTTYTAYFGFGGEAADLHALRNSSISQGAGVGMSAEAAEFLALSEALERHCGVAAGDEPFIRARYCDLDPDSVVDPMASMLYSQRQYAERDLINAEGAAFNLVPQPFDPAAEIEWTAAWSLSRSRFRLLPTSMLFYFQHQPPGGPYCWADSNGCAAGRSLGDAVRRGLLELIERDGVAIWWYNRLRRPAIDLTAVEDEDVQHLVAAYAGIGRDLWALDLTSDLGVPICAAVSRRRDGPSEDIVLGFGADLDPVAAVRHALFEVTHILPAVLPENRLEDGDYPYSEPAQKRWWHNATLDSEPYLRPAHGEVARWRRRRSTDRELADLRGRVERAGHEILVLDQTRPDVGLPVAKVIAPGLRHFWARYAPGRLYDVPVAQGWLDGPYTEDELNPIAMFL